MPNVKIPMSGFSSRMQYARPGGSKIRQFFEIPFEVELLDVADVVVVEKGSGSRGWPKSGGHPSSCHKLQGRNIKMKTAIIASLVASAAAFAPAKQAAQSTSLKAFEDALGAQAPLGFFDPLGLLKSGSQERFDRLRYVELKHGRISMLAVVGYLVQEAGIRLPGELGTGLAFADIPNGFAALKAIGGTGIAEIVALIGFLEFFVMKDLVGGEFPGDFRNGAIDFGWDSFDEETKLRKRAIELNQGRAAQMGILALMVHEQLGVSILPSL